MLIMTSFMTFTFMLLLHAAVLRTTSINDRRE
jgi:hypothetical protein